ncbi:MAG: DUF4390 domain-containing protein [Betaproteobacteria bacterium]
MRALRRNLPKLALLLALLLPVAQAARADDIELLEARLESTEEGVALNADFAFDFNARLEQAVTNGVALYFVVEFELTQPRWYWFDEKTATRRRQTRLSYHALSRHFRLSTGLLQQNYATLGEALAVLRRVRNWVVLDKSVPLSDAPYQASLRMRLDLSLLPKPFQVSALTSREWHLESEWRRFSWRPGMPPPPLPPVSPPTTPMAPQPTERREEGQPR